MLGPLLVQDARGPVVLGSAKRRALLALLLLQEPGHVVAAERLIDDLWGEDPPRSGVKALQVQVSHLRRALGSGQPIVTHPRGYSLDIDPASVDLHRFEAHLAEARRLRSQGAVAEALQALDAALREWRGPALSDVTLLGPASTEAVRLGELRRLAQEERVELQLERGTPAMAIPELEAMIVDDPYRERLYELLMLALYRSGRQADALETFRRARTLLVEELGLDPRPELVRLEAAILAHDPALDVAPVGAPARSQEPAVRNGPPVASATSSILGREAELGGALTLIGRPDVRLLTLTGTGGIGKTRLAVELATQLGQRARLVELASISDPDRVLAAIAAAIGADEASESSIAGVLSSESPVLFLDNFEQVLAAAPVVSSLLGAAPGLTVVVTSRAPLHIAGERELPVPPLDMEAAVELFVERASDQAPAFAPGSDDRLKIETICARLDGLPLAIELAAARTRILDPGQILDRIGRRLDLLTAGRRDAPERHRTLRATIAWSHDLLDAEDQRLFAQLSVFTSGWSLEACEAVAAHPVLDELSRLVEHGLVISNGSRFSMLETVREYASEQLDASDDADEVHRRQAQWCLALAEAAEPELTAPGQTSWFARLDPEQGNLRAAAAWALEHDEPEIALGLDGALWRFWLARGGAAEARETLSTALASGRGSPGLRVKALNAAGVLCGEALDVARAEAFFQEALELAGQLADRSHTARTLMNLGVVAVYNQDYPRALARYAEAGEIWQELGAPHGQSIMCQNQAIAYEMMGEPDRALPLLEQSVELARAAGDRILVAGMVVELAKHLVHHWPTDPRIPALLRESLQLAAGLGEQRLVIECLEVLGALGAHTGAEVAAAELIGTAERERVRTGVQRKVDEVPFFDATARELERMLGSEPYEQARARGANRDLADAVAMALRLTDADRARAARAK